MILLPLPVFLSFPHAYPPFFRSQTIRRPPASFTTLFRYHTKLEIIMNIIGLIAAIASGVAQVRFSPCSGF